MKSVSQCAFCPEIAELTGEHLWSDWIGSALGIRKYLITEKFADGSHRSYPKKRLNVKAKVVCGNCNSGWMSRLENNTKPFLHDMVLFGSAVQLNPTQVALLAAVSFKNAVVADHMHDNSPRFFSFAVRQRFAKTLNLPEGVQMWLSIMQRQRGLFKSGDLKTKPGARGGFEINLFTYGVAHLVVQVTTTRWTKIAHRRNLPPPGLTQHPFWDDASTPFWPARGSETIGWPPPRSLGDDMVETFADRWANLERLE